ncbi:MAG TPA: DUF4129 domain-containing protein [Anaerolineales bacterium]|nr:DUF4129 domain-containing protein [Anaerolineales bacterium]
MSETEFSEEIRYNEGRFRFVSYVLVVLMMTCIALTASALIYDFFPDWQSTVVALLSFAFSAEHLYSRRQFKRLIAFSPEWLIAHATEWVVIIFMVYVTVSWSHGFDSLWEHILLLGRGFFSALVYPEFLLALFLVMIIWTSTGYFAELLDEMEFEQASLALKIAGAGQTTVMPRDRLVSLTFTTGLFLVVITALVRAGVRELFHGLVAPTAVKLSLFSGGGASTLLYFVLGLALLSQTQFISLHTHWRLQEVTISRRVVERWIGYSLLFFAVLIILVGLLPTSYSLGALSAIGYVLDVLLAAFIALFDLVWFAVLKLLSLFFISQNKNSPELTPPTLSLPPELSVPPTAHPATPWLDMAKSILSWTLLLGIVIFSLIYFLRQHRDLARAIRRMPGGQWLLNVWDWLSEIFGGLRKGINQIVEVGRERLRAWRERNDVLPSRGFLSLRRLDPRRRVYYFYLALIRRGGEHGLPRASSQTPYEYASTLETALPNVDEDVRALTNSFVEARYSRRAIPAEEANLVKIAWAHIRQVLRNLKQK